jgi:hypothetical protein
MVILQSEGDNQKSFDVFAIKKMAGLHHLKLAGRDERSCLLF